MRKTPPIDPAPEPGAAKDDPATQPALRPAAADGDAHDQTLVWPPVDDDLSGWEVMQFQGAGDTIVAPPPGPSERRDPTPSGQVRPFTPQTPPPYVPPEPLDDPAGETSLLPGGPPPAAADFDLPQTELIEPLSEPGTQPSLAIREQTDRFSAVSPFSEPGEDRTVVIPRPAFGPVRPEPLEDTNPGNAATRVLISPAFAASMGHAPTVPVSAVHRAAAKPARAEAHRPMDDTLPAGDTRELPAMAHGRADADATGVARPHGDTHPLAAPVLQRVPVGSPPSSPFSRVASRGAQPVAPDPPPVVPATPLTFGPRGSSAAADAGAAPGFAPPVAAPSPQYHDPGVPARREPASTRTKIVSLGLGVAVLLLLAVGVYQLASMRNTSAGAPAMATLSVESTPAGAEVVIDGTPRGKTPVRLEIAEGAHALDVTHGGATKRIPLNLAAGTVTAHSLEFAAPAAAAAADAAIEVRSDPAGARVVIDGIERGRTPIVVTGLTSGAHEVKVSGPFRTVTRSVNLLPRQQGRLLVTPARTDTPPAAAAGERAERPARAAAGTGFVTIESPIVLRVVRNGDFIGTSEDGRLTLPVGNQVIGLENESVGFRDVRTVEVVAGKPTAIVVTPPNGAISINARPWAEVFVDGARVGETPVSQLSLPVGIHEIVFRHPEFGERRQSVVVKIGATGRAFTDFTK
jgi:hypothetical protein